MNISRIFFERIDEIAKHEVPADVMARARRSLLDYLAVTCAGAAFQKEKLNGYFDFAQPEAGSFNAIGTGKNFVLKEAVFLNGLSDCCSTYSTDKWVFRIILEISTTKRMTMNI